MFFFAYETVTADSAIFAVSLCFSRTWVLVVPLFSCCWLLEEVVAQAPRSLVASGEGAETVHENPQ